MKEDVIEGNRLIAEFMGYEYIGGDVMHYPYLRKGDEIIAVHNDVCFHSSWDWLMPVIEKICRMKIGDGVKTVDYAYPRTFGMLNAETGQIMVRLNGFQLQEADTLIEAAWLAVVDFIKWDKDEKIEQPLEQESNR